MTLADCKEPKLCFQSLRKDVAVSLRTREIGTRMALGATPGHVRRAFLREGLALSAAGMALGGLAAAALARPLAGQLPYVRPGDPVSFVVAAAVLAAVSALATFIPAARATRVDPLVALRQE